MSEPALKGKERAECDTHGAMHDRGLYQLACQEGKFGKNPSQTHPVNHFSRIAFGKLVAVDVETSLLDLDKIRLDELVM